MLPLAFGVSPPDIAIILVLALIVFGPKRLPELGKQLGQAMREMRKITEEMTGAMHSVNSEVESVYKPVLSPPAEYGNPYSGTSSAAVEKAVTRKSYDQDPNDLMVPVVHSALKSETQLELDRDTKLETKSDTAASDTADRKGH
ncbi:MAG: Sec-independent protein translocase subunit TatA/TatB [Janthinobacterium lividum]